MTGILAQFLSINDIFCKFALLNKEFSGVVNQLSGYKPLWMRKYMNEFENRDVKISTDSEDLYVEFLAFVNRFPDLDPEMDVFEMLKVSVEK